MILPLEGITVVDFTQLLSGPVSTLRLSDLGARVIKIENKKQGDLSRVIYGESVQLCGDSSFFQAINRNKESLCLDLKDPEDKARAVKLIHQADVVVHNFRPGVMNRLGFSFEALRDINPNIVVGTISGYGSDGPWSKEPGQDLLVQSLSGFVWQSGSDQQGPVPAGLAIADMFAGSQLVQGILAALVSGESTLVEVSMLEAMLDFQFEALTLFYQDGGKQLKRSEVNGAHPLAGAPYGLYKTADGYLSIAMGSMVTLATLLNKPELANYDNPSVCYSSRDEIKQILKDALVTNTTEHWLSIFEPSDIWCAEVLNWQQMLAHDGFKALDMLQTVQREGGENYVTTRCPIRIDGLPFKSPQGAPKLNQHYEALAKEFDL